MKETIPAYMQALLLTDDGPIVRDVYPTPVPQTGEALIRIHLAGHLLDRSATARRLQGRLSWRAGP